MGSRNNAKNRPSGLVLRTRRATQKKGHPKGCPFPGGREWIRTTEGVANRVTVCPLLPLGNSPILNYAFGAPKARYAGLGKGGVAEGARPAVHSRPSAS